MLTAHQTVKTAWSSFKSYPRLKHLLLYNFVALLPVLFISVIAMDSGANSISHSISQFILSIPSYIIYFLSGMAITHYVCTGWVFNGFRDFLRPPSSLWRLFWKSMVFYISIIVLFILGAVVFGMVMAMLPPIAMIVLGGVMSVVFLIAFIMLAAKLIIVYPYFTMNDNASLFSVLSYTNGHFWYLSKILGWMILYGLLLFIIFAIGLALFGLIAGLLGTLGVAVVTCLSLIIQALVTMLIAFIYAQTYKALAKKINLEKA